ncbi:hypothetical protein DSO57_1034067 [Entomophthora muscae]|uniref:Uncharacterized protein n=1 Tax=Entomophthora muscae TaxID=34485 RepID=A0ACC2TB10_9FUNG|nr:hypothetical protein DSO57_1034067 [Entomophthora muscae]
MEGCRVLEGVADLWIMDISPEHHSTELLHSPSPCFRGNAIFKSFTEDQDSDFSDDIDHISHDPETIIKPYQSKSIKCKLFGFNSEYSTKDFDLLAEKIGSCPSHDPLKTKSASKCHPFSKKILDVGPDCCYGGPEETPLFYNMLVIIPRSLGPNMEINSSCDSAENEEYLLNQFQCSCIDGSLLPSWVSQWMDVEKDTLIVLRDVEKLMGSGDAWSLRHHSCASEVSDDITNFEEDFLQTSCGVPQVHRKFNFKTTKLKTGKSALSHLKEYFGIDILKNASETFGEDLSVEEVDNFLASLLICAGRVEFSF